MANFVGNVLEVNFVQGPDYAQNAALSAAEALNSANSALNSANSASNSASIAVNNAIIASNSASQAASSANSASDSANSSANSALEALGYRNTAKIYADETQAHYNQFYIDLMGIKNFATDGFNRIDGNIMSINEWITLHNGAFSLYPTGIIDNDGVVITDNDGECFESKEYFPVTDPSLSQNGVPADAGAVGMQVKKLAKLNAIIEGWQDNFVQRVVAFTDSDSDYILDNDGVELLEYGVFTKTDDTLLLQGIPADAYAVGQALQAIRDLIATYHQ